MKLNNKYVAMTFGFLGLALVFNNCSQFSIDSDKNNSVGALELSGAQAGTAAENLWLRSQSSIASAMATVPRTNMAGCEITGDYRSERSAMGTRKNLLRRGRGIFAIHSGRRRSTGFRNWPSWETLRDRIKGCHRPRIRICDFDWRFGNSSSRLATR